MSQSGRSGSMNLLLDYDSGSDDESADSGYTSDHEKKRKSVEMGHDHQLAMSLNKKRRHCSEEEDEDMEVAVNTTHCRALSIPGLPFTHTAVVNNTHTQNNNDTCSNERLTSGLVTPIMNSIPLPTEFHNNDDKNKDRPELHGGRMRSFPHERGNWPSLLYIPIKLDLNKAVMESMIRTLCAACEEKTITMTPCDDLHISLSRTLCLMHQWITPIVNYLKSRLSTIAKFSIWLHGLSVFTNDEKTRTFIALKVFQGNKELQELVDENIDPCFQQFNLPLYYEDKMFHMSLAWCVGDHKASLECYLPALHSICQQYFSIEPEIQAFRVNNLLFKTGNRYHELELGTHNHI